MGKRSAEENENSLQYPDIEHGTFPEMRSYEEYVRDGTQAERQNDKEGVNGVKGIWKLHDLPYASDIFWGKDAMHCFANIIKDSFAVLRPSKGDFENRTEKKSVRNECERLGIFRELHNTTTPARAKWTLNFEEIQRIHEQLLKFPVGLRRPFLTGGGDYCHDKIIFATLYAPDLLSMTQSGSPLVTSNILEIFDLITHMTSYEFEISRHHDFMERIYDILSIHEGLLPPSEATYTLHEMVHIAQQIPFCGPPLMVSMFKYERQNKYLKKLLKNQRHPISSIMRNYQIAELSTLTTGTCHFNTNKLQQIFKYVDKGISENISSGLNGLGKLKYESPNKIRCEEIYLDEYGNVQEFRIPSPTLIQFLLSNEEETIETYESEVSQCFDYGSDDSVAERSLDIEVQNLPHHPGTVLTLASFPPTP
jgi:hypothetical protein